MNYYISVLKRYAVFSGRARRAEYWYFVLFNAIVGIAIQILFTVLATVAHNKNIANIAFLYTLAVLIPSFAVAVRRLHDTNRSGWWMLISLIPFIGVVALFVFMLLDSQTGSNKYGPNPKELQTA